MGQGYVDNTQAKVVVIRQGTPGTWDAEVNLNGMGSMDSKPITVCEPVFVVQCPNSLGQGVRGCVAEACGVAPADLLHRGIMDAEATMFPGTLSLFILVPIRVLLRFDLNCVFQSTSQLREHSNSRPF